MKHTIYSSWEPWHLHIIFNWFIFLNCKDECLFGIYILKAQKGRNVQIVDWILKTCWSIIICTSIVWSSPPYFGSGFSFLNHRGKSSVLLHCLCARPLYVIMDLSPGWQIRWIMGRWDNTSRHHSLTLSVQRSWCYNNSILCR